MIRGNDPTKVTLTMTLEDAAALIRVVQKATSAAVGVVFDPDDKKVWQNLQDQYERMSNIQKSIYAQLYAGPGAQAHAVVVGIEERRPWWKMRWGKR